MAWSRYQGWQRWYERYGDACALGGILAGKVSNVQQSVMIWLTFTDIYPTLADAAGVSCGEGDPIDGRSFLPQLCGQQGLPRDWVFLHYQPYWGAQPGQFARTQNYKLYRGGGFFNVPVDLEESNELEQADLTPEAALQKGMLLKVLSSSPPAPTEPGSRTTIDRPLYSEWPKLDLR